MPLSKISLQEKEKQPQIAVPQRHAPVKQLKPLPSFDYGSSQQHLLQFQQMVRNSPVVQSQQQLHQNIYQPKTHSLAETNALSSPKQPIQLAKKVQIHYGEDEDEVEQQRLLPEIEGEEEKVEEEAATEKATRNKPSVDLGFLNDESSVEVRFQAADIGQAPTSYNGGGTDANPGKETPTKAAEIGNLTAGGVDILEGTFGLIQKGVEIRQLFDDNTWDFKKAANLGTKIYDASIKISKGSVGVASLAENAKQIQDGNTEHASSEAANLTLGIFSSLKALKESVLLFIHLFQVGKNRNLSKQKTADLSKELLTAAKDGFTSAKSLYGFAHQGASIGSSITYTIPGLDIAIRVIDLFSNFIHLFGNRTQKELMTVDAKNLREAVLLGFYGKMKDSTLNDSINDGIFHKEKRGVMGGREIYYRTNNSLQENLEAYIEVLENEGINTIEGDNTNYEERKDSALNNLIPPISRASVPAVRLNQIKTIVPQQQHQSSNKAPNPEAMFKEIKGLPNKIAEYELVDKLAEINKKREVNNMENIFLATLHVAGDILAIVGTAAGGVSGSVGVGLKAGAAGIKATHSSGKYLQGIARDTGIFKGNQARSKRAKYAEYVRHVDFIMERWADLRDSKGFQDETLLSEEAKKKLENTEKYIRATGTTPEALLHTDTKLIPDKLLEALSKR